MRLQLSAGSPMHTQALGKLAARLQLSFSLLSDYTMHIQDLGKVRLQLSSRPDYTESLKAVLVTFGYVVMLIELMEGYILLMRVCCS